MDDKEKPAIEKAADTVNDVVEKITLKAADAAIEPDPEHIAGATNEQVYLPEATETAASHSGRITPTYESMLPPFVGIPRRKKSTSKKAPKKAANKAGKKAAKKSAKKSSAKSAKKSSAKKKAAKQWKSSAERKAVAKKTAKKLAKKKKAGKKARR
jgi:hypothetical protein